MNKEKNKYEEKAKKAQAFLSAQRLATKGSVKHTAVETIKDLVVGVVGGGLAGAAVGKPSLLLGLGTTAIGHFTGIPMITSFGFGMMASGGYQLGADAVNGLSGIEGAKERVKAFGQNIKKQFYLDKIIKPKETKKEEGTEGLGNVQYFKYPQELDMGALDNIEREIARSAEDFNRNNDVSGFSEEKLY